MAFPVVLGVATATSGGTGTNENRVHAIPASEAGNLLLIQFGLPGSLSGGLPLAISLPTGWIEFHNNGHSDNTSSRHIWLYKQADGSEGTSVAYTITNGSSTSRIATICYRIAGHEDPSVQPPQASSVVTNPSGLSTTSGSPPSLSPTGGEKDYLWFATICFNGTTNGTVTAPSPYTDLQNATANQQGDSNGGRVCSARRELRASSTNPGNFTWVSSTRWQAVTIAVHPSPAPPPTATLSGTVTDPTNEGDIRNGGRTIILTLSNGSWVSGASFDAVRQDIIDGLTALSFQANGWEDVIKPLIEVTGVVRTSDTQVTITLPAATTYSPAQDETIRAIIPLTAVGAGWNEAVQPAIPLDNVVRTSDMVVTISLPSVAGYSIGADEEIEAAIPGAVLTPDNPDFSGDPVAAEPTFTFSDLEEDSILAEPTFTVLVLAASGAFGPVSSQQRLLLL
jgi:hypothetical protein